VQVDEGIAGQQVLQRDPGMHHDGGAQQGDAAATRDGSIFHGGDNDRSLTYPQHHSQHGYAQQARVEVLALPLRHQAERMQDENDRQAQLV